MIFNFIVLAVLASLTAFFWFSARAAKKESDRALANLIVAHMLDRIAKEELS